MRSIVIIRDKCSEGNKFRVLFNLFNKYLREIGLFNKKNIMPVKHNITTEQLWTILIEDKKHDLIKVLKRVENKEPGYGSIVVPKNGFSDNKEIHNFVLFWLKERDINIVNVDNEISCLKDSLKV